MIVAKLEFDPTYMSGARLENLVATIKQMAADRSMDPDSDLDREPVTLSVADFARMDDGEPRLRLVLFVPDSPYRRKMYAEICRWIAVNIRAYVSSARSRHPLVSVTMMLVPAVTVSI